MTLPLLRLLSRRVLVIRRAVCCVPSVTNPHCSLSTLAARAEEAKQQQDACDVLLHTYKSQVAAGVLQPDHAQLRAVSRLNRLAHRLVRYKHEVEQHTQQQQQQHQQQKAQQDEVEDGEQQQQQQDPDSAKPTTSVPRGMFLHGPVGVGKSMIMDLFARHCAHTLGDAQLQPYNSNNTATTTARGCRRVHFHAFMLSVHQRIHAIRCQAAADASTTITAEGDALVTVRHSPRAAHVFRSLANATTCPFRWQPRLLTASCCSASMSSKSLMLRTPSFSTSSLASCLHVALL